MQAINCVWALLQFWISKFRSPFIYSSYASASNFVTASVFYLHTSFSFFAQINAFRNFFIAKNLARDFCDAFLVCENLVSLAKAQFFSELKSRTCRILRSLGFSLSTSFLVNLVLLPYLMLIDFLSFKILLEQYRRYLE